MLTSTEMPLEVTSEKKKRKDAAVLAGEQRLQLWPVGSRLCHGFVHSTSPGDLIVCQSHSEINPTAALATFLCNKSSFFM